MDIHSDITHTERGGEGERGGHRGGYREDKNERKSYPYCCWRLNYSSVRYCGWKEMDGVHEDGAREEKKTV